MDVYRLILVLDLLRRGYRLLFFGNLIQITISDLHAISTDARLQPLKQECYLVLTSATELAVSLRMSCILLFCHITSCESKSRQSFRTQEPPVKSSRNHGLHQHKSSRSAVQSAQK